MLNSTSAVSTAESDRDPIHSRLKITGNDWGRRVQAPGWMGN
jgi:hypothetical protein